MTTDCIVIEPSIFYKLKESRDFLNDKIAQRIGSLLASYTCFKEGPHLLPSPNHTFNPKYANKGHANAIHHHGGQHTNKNRLDYVSRRRNPHYASDARSTTTMPINQRRPKQTSVEREITSMLNKITNGNYERISAVLKTLTFDNADNLSIFLSHILAKCQRQACFITLYLTLLQDIHQSSSEEMQNRIKDFVSDHVTKALYAQTELQSFTLRSKNYDEFCSHLITKSDIIGNHKTILQIMELYPHMMRPDMLMDSYFEDIFRQTRDVGEMTSSHRNTDLHELLLEMLIDFVKLNTVWKARIENYFSEKNKLDTYSSKAKFKVMDIIN
jgi:hypothetical protein